MGQSVVVSSEQGRAAIESDYGLSIGGKFKLQKSNTLRIRDPNQDLGIIRREGNAMRCLDISFFSNDNNQFIVSTDVGQIIRGVRFGQVDFSLPSHSKPGFATRVSAVDFSPFDPSLFLAAMDDATVALFSVHTAAPLYVWEAEKSKKSPILSVAWSRTRSTVFYATTATQIYVWDISANETSPAVSEPFSAKKSPVTAMTLR